MSDRGDKAVLTPIDEAYALRPSLAHMSSTRNEADAKAKAAAEDEEEEKPSEPQHIRVCCLLPWSWAGNMRGGCSINARSPLATRPNRVASRTWFHSLRSVSLA